MKLVHKILDFEVSQVDEAARTFWAVASTGGVDRQGDLIESAGWQVDNFLKNPVIPWAHDYAAPPVAKALAVRVQGDKLLFQAQFPTAQEYAFADTIYKLYRGGYLRAFSVGFAPLESRVVVHQVEGRAHTGNHYLKQELYEISCVTLPANPQALAQLALKGLSANGLFPSTPSASASPAGGPGTPPPLPAASPAARAILAHCALGALVESRLRYHLGLLPHRDI
ncbi:MAG: HK97 family phage prohead protease [Desulfarculus sp.]|nr:HK97 family phage prohead protease [Desulfarculus sp.]